jgi:hypothetical protein
MKPLLYHWPFRFNDLRKADETNGDSEMPWVRGFTAVNVQDGSVIARWRAQFPHRSLDADRDHFLRLDNNLFYITAEEFTELNLEDIRSKRHGWR